LGPRASLDSNRIKFPGQLLVCNHQYQVPLKYTNGIMFAEISMIYYKYTELCAMKWNI